MEENTDTKVAQGNAIGGIIGAFQINSYPAFPVDIAEINNIITTGVKSEIELYANEHGNQNYLSHLRTYLLFRPIQYIDIDIDIHYKNINYLMDFGMLMKEYFDFQKEFPKRKNTQFEMYVFNSNAMHYCKKITLFLDRTIKVLNKDQWQFCYGKGEKYHKGTERKCKKMCCISDYNLDGTEIKLVEDIAEISNATHNWLPDVDVELQYRRRVNTVEESNWWSTSDKTGEYYQSRNFGHMKEFYEKAHNILIKLMLQAFGICSNIKIARLWEPHFLYCSGYNTNCVAGFVKPQANVSNNL